MNTADRAKLQQLLVKALDQAFEEASGEVRMPLLGDSSLYHMANSVINILEAFEDVEDYIGNQLSDEERESLGI